ncbi:diacylglycerol kinase [Campylobacter sp. MIT 99-7217]|uniref:diacylglycerol kinase n=1 Tax=Campylobacter sp. MIT 99-7217 TaxID=535091 RepID=UPI001158187A|nr:diacylglycerol kinase [Campylobacter sp. MIT 99-7217]TQR32467.1 diacylglycerol kinase [Campylobacter sp. MIT 99-7217]
MKPKYNFFKNTGYALCGLKFMLLNEKSFKIELFIIIPLIIFSLFLRLDLFAHLLLIAVLFLILILECVNSAIEACVDLCSPDFHPLAKIAKDCASGAICLSISLAAIMWAFILFDLWF